jgi:hypothetical protein
MSFALQYEEIVSVLWSELWDLGYLHLTSYCSSLAFIRCSSSYMAFAIRESNIMHVYLTAAG